MSPTHDSWLPKPCHQWLRHPQSLQYCDQTSMPVTWCEAWNDMNWHASLPELGEPLQAIFCCLKANCRTCKVRYGGRQKKYEKVLGAPLRLFIGRQALSNASPLCIVFLGQDCETTPGVACHCYRISHQIPSNKFHCLKNTWICTNGSWGVSGTKSIIHWPWLQRKRKEHQFNEPCFWQSLFLGRNSFRFAKPERPPPWPMHNWTCVTHLLTLYMLII